LSEKIKKQTGKITIGLSGKGPLSFQTGIYFRFKRDGVLITLLKKKKRKKENFFIKTTKCVTFSSV
jgi:hypothetical protein